MCHAAAELASSELLFARLETLLLAYLLAEHLIRCTQQHRSSNSFTATIFLLPLWLSLAELAPSAFSALLLPLAPIQHRILQLCSASLARTEERTYRSSLTEVRPLAAAQANFAFFLPRATAIAILRASRK